MGVVTTSEEKCGRRSSGKEECCFPNPLLCLS
jgi:hypothetical protein